MTEASSLTAAQLGEQAFARGQVLAAKEFWAEALAQADASGIVESRVRMRNAQGNLLMELGMAQEALIHFEQALELLDTLSVPDARNRTRTLLNCLFACHFMAKTDDAWRYVSLARESADLQDDQNLKARVYHNLSAFFPAMEAWDDAIAAGGVALQMYEALGHFANVAQVMLNIGVAKSGLGHPDAKDFFLKVIELASGQGDFQTLAFAYTELAKEALKGDLVEEALDYGRQALQIHWAHFSTLDKAEVARVIEILGRVALKTGDRALGLNFLQRASTYFAQRNLWREWSDLTRLMDDEVRSQGSSRVTGRTPAISLDSSDREIMDYFTSLFSLLDVLEGMYPGIKGRSEMVTRYALMLAQQADASEADLEVLSHAGRLHDIGFTSVDLEVVDSIDNLTGAARRRAEAHPVIGEQTLMGFPVPSGCTKVTRHHHECWDGTGYPDGLKAGEIPWLSRVLAVADVYVSTSLVSRHTLGLKAIEDAARSRLDPELVSKFVDMHR